eukprot:TRINITY_DN1733_c0_g1_i4.p1 TRINITY_DN1733_c0_g1~~TRINITY_DN1733_c0_g1_i4.p1  ORF type:complete len:158 (+),score=26.88 TRINITY_DN1733_c0_g1_i4:179-652(+)
MPKFVLDIKCNLEGLTDLALEEPRFNLRVSCTSCGEEMGDLWVSKDEEAEMPGGRSTANLVFKCKGCRRDSSISIIDSKIDAYTADDDGSFRPLCEFDFRGIEPMSWQPAAGFTVKGANSSKSFEVDLTELEFFDYDDEGGNPVSITNVESQFRKEK